MSSSRKSIVRRLLFVVFFVIPLFLIIEIPIFIAGASLGTYLYFSNHIPDIPTLASYQPKTVSTFFADDGKVIGIFYKEKRFVVDLDQIPNHVVNAFIAAEDARFYEHNGVDWSGILRAIVRNVKARRILMGGSTITMQVTRNFMLTRERSFSRKVKEMILAPRLEGVWGKQKVLHVYLNEIYLGEGNYGVEAASRGYFDKPVQHLSVAEAALIAGLVPSPARYNPFKSEELARQKQLIVLGRMLKVGVISQEEYDKAKNEPMKFKRDPARPFDLVPDFAEAVRRYIIKKYGEEKLYNEGLKVFTTCRVEYQQKALESLEKGIQEIKSRQKHLAIINTLPKEDIPELLQKKSDPDLVEGRLYQGVVMKTARRGKEKDAFDLELALSNNSKGIVHVDQSGSVYKIGHVLAIRFNRFEGSVPVFDLDSDPKLQGALVCIENKTGFVRALLGGASGEHFKFNRATQARRQPGSSFKPIIYSTALETRSYSPATIIVDEPIEVKQDESDQQAMWEPRNSGGNFLGPLTFRRALELSRNICTIKILMDTNFDPVIDMARKMGITSDLGKNLSLSLGTSETSLFEMTSAYTVFPNGGVHLEPVLVKRVEDRFGNVLEDNTDLQLLDESEIPTPMPREDFADRIAAAVPKKVPERKAQKKSPPGPSKNPSPLVEQNKGPKRAKAAMSPQTAYIMTSLLQGGVQRGTGARISHYVKRRDLAGKTGTTNQAADTWFIGFNPEFTTGVWVGFDEKRPLGNKEEGARAALPIWGYFMNDILDKRPQRDFAIPPDVTFQELPIIAGNMQQGFTFQTVREPVYTPFVGYTLASSPIDPPEILAQYVPTMTPETAVRPAVGPPVSTHQQLPVPNGAPQQPAAPRPGSSGPLNPMDGRNLFPDANTSRPAVNQPPKPPQSRQETLNYR